MFGTLAGWIIDRLTAAPAVKAASDWIGPTVRPGEVASGRMKRSSQMELISRYTETVYFCASTTAAACASCRLRLYTSAGASDAKAFGARRVKRVTDRKRLDCLRDPGIVGRKAAAYADVGEVVEIDAHPVLDHLNAPNPWIDGYEYAYLGFLFRELAANDYRYYTEGEGDSPIFGFHLYPQHTSIQPSEEEYVSGYWFARDTSDERFYPAEEVDHYKFASSPVDPYYGTGPLHACFKSLDILSAATDSELYRWINGGQPDWVVVAPPGTTEDQRKAIQTAIEKRVKGIKNRGKFLVTSGGVDIKPGAYKPMELEYGAGMDRQDLVIARCYGMTEAQLKVNSANVASAREGARWWRENAILPRVTKDATEQTERLLPRFGLEPGEYWLAYDNPVPQDEVANATRAVSLYGGGLLTKNEARAELGYDAVDDGDEFKTEPAPSLTFGMGPSLRDDPRRGRDDDEESEDDQASETDDERGKRIPAGGDGAGSRDRRRKRGAGGAGDRDVRGRAHDDGAAGRRGDKGRGVHAGAGRDPLNTKDDDRLTEEETILRAFQRDLESWYRRATAGIRPDGSVDLSPYDDELNAILDDHLPGLMRLAIVTGQRDVDMQPDPARAQTDAEQYVEAYSPRLARVISDSEQQALEQAVSVIVGEGKPLAEAIQEVRASGVEETPWKAERIVRSETAHVNGVGQQHGWKLGGATRKLRVLSSDPCPLCEGFQAQYAAEPVPIDGAWARAGQTVTGTDGRTATLGRDVVAGSEVHPQCSCSSMPVFDDDEAKTAKVQAIAKKRMEAMSHADRDRHTHP